MNEEMLAKLQKARTVEEIIAIAKEYGKEVTAEKAQELLDKISGATGELSDDALAAVAGGAGSTTSRNGSEASLASKMPEYEAGRERLVHVPFPFAEIFEDLSNAFGYPESWMIWRACSFTFADIRMRRIRAGFSYMTLTS